MRNRAPAGTVQTDMGTHQWLRSRPASVAALALGLVLAIPALTACATPTPNRQAAGEASTSAPTTTGVPATSAAASRSPGANEENPGDMTDPTLPGVQKTLRGTTADGVEPNCVLLTADDGQSYLLIGGDRQVIMGGGRLEVTGKIQPDLMTTCQQGIPFTVATVRKI